MKLNENFCIRKDYQIREITETINAAKRSDAHQINVYLLAQKIAEDNNVKHIADVGCGSGFKLKKYFDNYDIIGYDLEPNVLWLNEKYPTNKWIVSDFNSAPDKADLVICADVIEHVDNPNELFNFIIKMKPEHIIISTPDRNQLNEKLNRPELGPPGNKHHVREWSFDEFASYIDSYFYIILHNKIEKEYAQVIYCKLKLTL